MNAGRFVSFTVIAFSVLFLPFTSMGQNRAGWMKEARWGVMNHYLADWLADSYQIEMSPAKWNQLVDAFDVEAIANQLDSIGAGYYIFTIGQNSGYYVSPNKAYDEIVGNNPGKCAHRDLIADLASAVRKKGIRFIVYLPSGAPAGDDLAKEKLEWKNGPYRNAAFQNNWERIIREWSLRWGDKIDGWWFDGCYWPNTMYRSCDQPNFESFAAAARAGNPNSSLAFCQGVLPRIVSLTPFEDYIAGEMSNPDDLSVRRSDDGIIDGAQLHILSYLGEKWGKGKPRFETEKIVGWSRNVWKEGGAITWDVPVGPDGTISKPFMDQLRAIQHTLK